VSNDNGPHMSQASWTALDRHPEDFQHLLWLLHMAAELAQKVSLDAVAVELLYLQSDLQFEVEEACNQKVVISNLPQC